MKDNSFLLMMFVAFPICTGALVFFLVVGARRLSSIACTHCLRRIPKAIIDEQLPCPFCDEFPRDPLGLGHNEHTARVPEDGECCHHCEQILDHIANVRLWDGNFYCIECVSSEDPELLNLAQSSDKFEESVLHSAWKVAGAMFAFATLGIAIFAGIIAALIAWAGRPETAFHGFAVIMFIGSPVILLWVAAVGLGFNAHRPVITVRDGKLVCRMGMQLVAAPVTECHWFVGKSSQMTAWQLGFLIRGRAIVVEIPRSRTPQGNRLAVGFNEKTMRTWRAFFTICRVPQLQATSKPQ